MSIEDIEEFVTVTVTVGKSSSLQCPRCLTINGANAEEWLGLAFDHPGICGECGEVSPRKDWKVVNAP